MIVEERSPTIFAQAIEQVAILLGITPKATIAQYALGIGSRQDLSERSRTQVIRRLEAAYEQGQQVMATQRQANI